MATEITTVEELEGIADNLSGDYVLADDIDASGYDFTPIGDANTPFTGALDGQGHTVQGLTVNSSGYGGLFGKVDGSVTNVILDSPDISGTYYTGGLAGYVDGGSVSKCLVIDGSVVADDDMVGGVIGRLEYVSGAPVATELGFSGTVEESTQNGNNVGGVVGDCRWHIERCYAEGAVIGGGSSGATGGIAGYAICNVHDCFSHADVKAGEDVAAGIGSYYPWDTETTETCYATGTVKAGTATASTSGFSNGSDTGGSNVYWDTEATGMDTSVLGTGLTTDEMTGSSAADSLSGFDFSEVWDTQEADYPAHVWRLEWGAVDEGGSYSAWSPRIGVGNPSPSLESSRITREQGVQAMDGKTLNPEGDNYVPNHWRWDEDVPHWFFGFLDG